MTRAVAIAPGRISYPWIQSAWFDGLAILAPAWLTGLAVLVFADFFRSHAEVTPMWWLLLVVGVDVAHVYSTIFRTYLDRSELARRPVLYIGIPVIGWLGGVVLYSFGALTFWRCLAYLAVFHFMRQQYGFMMIYSRRDQYRAIWAKRIDAATISMAMLYPLLYWHSHLPQNFDWFVSGDFIALPSWIDATGFFIYALTLAAFLGKEIWFWRHGKRLNLCRWLLIGGTAISWYCGIIVTQGDLAFTLTNVVAHGVPYTALIWIYRRNQDRQRQVAKSLFTPTALPLYLGILITLAYLEEGIWDGVVWREHLDLFLGAAWLPAINVSSILTWLVPLLALPQISHYLLDGFIWRFKSHPEWRHIMFPQAKTRPS